MNCLYFLGEILLNLKKTRLPCGKMQEMFFCPYASSYVSSIGVQKFNSSKNKHDYKGEGMQKTRNHDVIWP